MRQNYSLNKEQKKVFIITNIFYYNLLYFNNKKLFKNIRELKNK